MLQVDNQGMLTSNTKIDTKCKKKHVQIFFKIYEFIDAGFTNFVKIDYQLHD